MDIGVGMDLHLTVRLRYFYVRAISLIDFYKSQKYKITNLRKHIMRERESHKEPTKVDINGLMV